jgi:tRNA dimethylallyltransferase
MNYGIPTKILIIVGPTAVGKSKLAVKLAKKFNGEIISADSRQVYRQLNLGTGKITKKEMGGIRHYLLDIVDPRRQYNVNRFVKEARRAINTIVQKKKLPIVCGGTGLYVDSLLGKITWPQVPPNRRLRQKLANRNTAQLFKLLRTYDPHRARLMNESDRNNPRRLIRAIEITSWQKSHPQSFLTADNNQTKDERNWVVLKIGLILPPRTLRRRIRSRLLARLRRGMIAEAKQLHLYGLSWERMDALGLEYRWLAKYLQKQITKLELKRKLENEIWRYAKRQITWFKRDSSIKWHQPSQQKLIYQLVTKFLIN